MASISNVSNCKSLSFPFDPIQWVQFWNHVQFGLVVKSTVIFLISLHTFDLLLHTEEQVEGIWYWWSACFYSSRYCLHYTFLNPDQRKNKWNWSILCVYAAAGFEPGVMVWCTWCHGVHTSWWRSTGSWGQVYANQLFPSCSLGTFWLEGVQNKSLSNFLFGPISKRSIYRYLGPGWL